MTRQEFENFDDLVVWFCKDQTRQDLMKGLTYRIEYFDSDRKGFRVVIKP